MARLLITLTCGSLVLLKEIEPDEPTDELNNRHPDGLYVVLMANYSSFRPRHWSPVLARRKLVANILAPICIFA
jgi:hypothetical protein